MTSSNAVVGPVTKADGAEHVLRSGRSGELVVTELHGRYYETAFRQKLFYSYCTAKTLVAANTTYTGHLIWNSSNQTGSGVNLVLQKIGIGVSVTSASMTGIAIGMSVQPAIPTGLTAATQAGCTFLSAAVGSGLSYSAATITNAGTPVFPLLHNTAAINTVGLDSVVVDMEGSIIVPPGYTAHLLALGAASAASAVTSAIFWEEIAV